MMIKLLKLLLLFFVLANLGGISLRAEQSQASMTTDDPAMKDNVRDVRKLFQHDKHKLVFDRNDITCLKCHKMAKDAGLKTSLGTKSKNIWGDIDEEAVKASCHGCHVGPKRTVLAADRCILCHTQRQAPPDHIPFHWKQNHKLSANNNSGECLVCHQKKDCVSCHQSRETIQANMHPRSFRYFHSIEARANGKSCANCHKSNFCTDCHIQGIRP